MRKFKKICLDINKLNQHAELVDLEEGFTTGCMCKVPLILN